MKSLAALLLCVACGVRSAPPVVSLEKSPVIARIAQAPLVRAPSTRIVVTGAPYGALALWRPYATGAIEAVAFPWAKLSIIDSLVVSPDGRDVAYVEGGSAYGPLLVRALADGAKTVVAGHVAERELLVVAWSPSGRQLLYASRRAGQLRPACDFSGCPGPGPSSYFVFDRASASTVKIDVPGELAAWLASGDVLVTDDDGAITRVDHATHTKTPVAVGPRRHNDFSLDAPTRRVLSTSWNDATKQDELLALDLTTWTETAIAPPARYATYHLPAASPSGKRVAWLATVYGRRTFAETLVVDGKTLVPETRELVGFTWIDDHALVAHFANRIDVIDANDGTVRGSQVTSADDMMR